MPTEKVSFSGHSGESLAARLDMPVCPRAGNDGRGAERAFRRVRIAVEFNLGTAVRACENAGFLDLGRRQFCVERGAKIQLSDRADPCIARDLFLCAAMIADQLARFGGEAVIGAALRAGETMVFGCHFSRSRRRG